MTTRLVLADDHPLVLEGLRMLLHAIPDFDVVGTATNGYEALDAVRRLKPDILVLDLRMPALGGLDLLRRLAHEDLTTRVVVLTAGLWEREVVDAARLGAAGVVLKESATEVLVECVRTVARGERYLGLPALAEAVAAAKGGDDADDVLTPRELEVVRLAAQGLRNRDIAARLHVTDGTVKVHLHNIYEKLGLDGRLALARYADDRGLV